MDTSRPPLLIVGTGAMASLFAARLLAKGISVKMLGSWHDGLQALKTRGVCFLDADGSQHVYRVQVTNDPQECVGVNLALVLVKSYQTARAARQLAECLAPEGLALTLQNGLDNKAILEEALGAHRVALGVTTIGATLLEPGYVRIGGDGIISVGEHPRLSPLLSLLKRAGFVVNVVTDTESLVWGKLIVNAAINPLTALLRVPNGVLLEKAGTRELMAILANEAMHVAQAQGISLPFSRPVEYVEHVAARTASNVSSMLKDVLRGSPTEVDSINGAIVRVGEAFGVPVVVNRTMWCLVKSLEPTEGVNQNLFVSHELAKRDPVALERATG